MGGIIELIMSLCCVVLSGINIQAKQSDLSF